MSTTIDTQVILSDTINRLSESETLLMAQKSRELKAQGYDVISLSVGEPDFHTPEHIKEAGKKAIDENYTTYTPVGGYPELKKAICDKLKRENGLEYKESEVFVSAGAKHSLANAVMCMVNEGEEVIIPSPYWITYRELVKVNNGVCKFIPTSIDNDFKITPEQLEAAITDKTKMMIFSSPCNPSGSLYSKEELKALAEVIARHPNIYVISDEIYEHINFSAKHESIAQFAEVKDRIIIINGVSKAYAMTGWRIGYMAGPEWLIKACNKLQGQITSGICGISQKAAEAALNAGLDTVKEMVTTFKERRDLVLKMLNEIPGIKTNLPLGAFYVFPDVSYYLGKTDGNTQIKDTDDLCMYILNKAYVATVPGVAFGDPNCIRLSYAASEAQLIEAINRIKQVLSQLK